MWKKNTFPSMKNIFRKRGIVVEKDTFKEYMRESEPDKAHKDYAWSTAIGLQAVDELIFGEGNTRTTAVFFIKYLRTRMLRMPTCRSAAAFAMSANKGATYENKQSGYGLSWACTGRLLSAWPA